MLHGWNQSYCQLSRGSFDGAIQAVSVDGAFVFLESANLSLLQEGSLEPGAIGIAVPVRLGGPARFCGHDCYTDQLYIYSGRTGFEFCSPSDHQVAGISFEPESMAALMGQAGEAFPAAWLDHADTQDADPAALLKVRRFVVELMAAGSATPAMFDSTRARAALKDEIAAHLINLFVNRYSVQAQRTVPHARARLVSRARERVNEHPNEPVSIATLCAELAVSRRTLQYCFQNVLGITPNTYLRAIRLNGVRAALRSAPSVTHAALDWGFWHLGQFAADYRQMFGELPSQTFQKDRKFVSAEADHYREISRKYWQAAKSPKSQDINAGSDTDDDS